MQRYNPKDIEAKWQAQWEADKIYQATEDPAKPKKYVLEYFPYPSGAAMHVGHVRNYTIGDAIARFNRMQGFNVLHPMGWDAFGLPAENYAIKNNVSPRVAIDENTTRFKQQLMQMGFSYDWSREIDSTDPKYYRWTQWFFLLLFKKGLAYQQESLQWWCPHDKTVLANEQVEAGLCWRCGNAVEKKALKQWFFKITDYADRLLDDLDDLNWSDSIKSMQRNWIGRSKGAEIDFPIKGSDKKLRVFTTRPDTLFGVTFMVLAPEHPLVSEITIESQKALVEQYQKDAQAKSDVERQEASRDKTGAFTGTYAINPINGKEIPVWIADYVLGGYGTGAIMAVPAHDERDNEFADMYDLDIIPVVRPTREDALRSTTVRSLVDTHPQSTKLQRSEDATYAAILSGEKPYSGEGAMINSENYDEQSSAEARENIVKALEESGAGKEVVNYKMRDWLISRQRYWGAPIPIVHCAEHGAVAVPDDQLPVVLPEVESYEPSGDGRSPLANVDDFVNTTCPQCGGPATRETDTMDGFACSSWYFLRFADPHNDDEPFSAEKATFWLPVDDYIGGAEHAVMHLLYARFWTKVMYDEGLINFTEPFKTLRNQGMILAPDGQKMSKSKGNTIEPDSLIDQGYGADSTRIMELFIGPWNQSAAWSVEGMGGSFRFLQRIWTLVDKCLAAEQGTADSADLLRAIHKATKKVTQDLHELGFNTAIAAQMECVNELYAIMQNDGFAAAEWRHALTTLVQLLAPFAPHISEELWHQLGQTGSVHLSEWPTYNEQYLVQDTITVVVQINGKVRAQISVATDADEATVVAAAQAHERTQEYLAGQTIRKTIYVPGKLVSFVI